MSLAESIEQLQQLAEQITREALIDDKTSLGSALALRQERRITRVPDDIYVVVFGDLNDFKHINDDYSHEAGDVALRAVGEFIDKKLLKDLNGKAFRQSGDEFVILLERDSLTRFLARVARVQSIPFSHNRNELKTAISFGYAISDGRTSFDDLMQRADAACQMAKRPGSSQCVKWSNNIETNPLVRIGAWCSRCNAKISCTLPKSQALPILTTCPSCGKPLSNSPSKPRISRK